MNSFWDWSEKETDLEVLTWGENEEQESAAEDEGDSEADEEQNEVEADSSEASSNSSNTRESSPKEAAEERRVTRLPTWMRDYESGEVLSEEEDLHNLAMFVSNEDPTSYEEAALSLKWRKAMDVEIAAIVKNKTWELVDLPMGAKKIGVKWVYKTKLDENGKFEKCKARLVAKGYAQEHGIDFSEVFAPVARWDTIRMVLALAAQRGWIVFRLDVKSAFLHGELSEDDYVDQPLGYIKEGEENKVYKLKKALYGLR